MSLEFARELAKQIDKVIINSEKDNQKKKPKKEESSKKQNDPAKIREVVIVQELLKQLQNESVRADFLAGANGANKLDPSDLELLDLL